MSFFAALRNFIRCTFCTRIYCISRFSVGSRHYYSNLGFVRTQCPKKRKSRYLAAKELKEKILENAQKEEKEND